jgi:hypothetical protein
MQTDIIKISKCCHTETYQDNDPEKDEFDIWDCCQKCSKRCETEEVCAVCHGTGEVRTMEEVYPGEPHTAPIGSQKCLCQLKDDDE